MAFLASISTLLVTTLTIGVYAGIEHRCRLDRDFDEGLSSDQLMVLFTHIYVGPARAELMTIPIKTYRSFSAAELFTALALFNQVLIRFCPI